MQRDGSRRRLWSALLAAAISAAIALIYLFGGGQAVFGELELRSLEWRMQARGPRPAPEEVAILAIDDETLLAQGRWPLPRALLAEAVARAEAAGAQSIGVDILLIDAEPGPSEGLPSEGDRRLQTVLGVTPRVVLGLALLFQEAAAPMNFDLHSLEESAFSVVVTPSEGALRPPRAQGVLQPAPPLRQSSRQGHVNVILLGSASAAYLYPAVLFHHLVLPSFPLVLAAEQRGLLPDRLGLSLEGRLLFGDQAIPLDVNLALPLNPYGPEGTIPTYSLQDLLDDTLPPDALAGKAVMIGATAVGLGERFRTAYASDLPGVELLASGSANLLDGSSLLRNAQTRAFDSAAIFVLGLLAWGLGRFLAIGLALTATALLLAAWWALGFLALTQELIWIAAVAPTVTILLGSALGVVSRTMEERLRRAEAERQRSNLARYVSPLMAERLAASERPDFDRRLQEASILFIDLGGFTGESEQRSLQDTADFLVDYHSRLERIVLAEGGVIEQFQGDGAMVIFGLPEPQPDDAARALACAREAVADLYRWRPEVGVRVGLHDGSVVIAQLGGQSQAQLAAAGDTVNVASRLEQLAKEEGVAVVISEDLARKVEVQGRADLLAGFRLRPGRAIRGRRDPMDLRLASLADLGLTED